MSEPILVTGAAAEPKAPQDAESQPFCWRRAFRFVPSFIGWMQGPMLCGNLARKLSKGICWTQIPFALR
jgi:hypothetical protein